MKCTCIVCLKELDNLKDETPGNRGFHPVGGLEFYTYGHYGSTIFDPMDGSTLHIVICDNCVRKELKHQRIKREDHDVDS